MPYWYPEISETKCVWVPHSAGERFLHRELNHSAKNSVLVSGHIRPFWYPCRYAAAKLAHPERFVVLPHPDTVDAQNVTTMPIVCGNTDSMQQQQQLISAQDGCFLREEQDQGTADKP